MPLVYKETVAAKINGGMIVIELPLQIGGCRSDLYRFVFIFIYLCRPEQCFESAKLCATGGVDVSSVTGSFATNFGRSSFFAVS